MQNNRNRQVTSGQSNTEFYSSPEAVEKYVALTKDGLFEHEQRAIEQYFTEDQARTLDIGCGAGRTTAVLSEMGLDVVGLDISAPLIQQARSLFPHIDFQIGNVCELAFADEAFDYVLFSFNGLDEIGSQKTRHAALKEIHRVLCQGGRFIFSNKNSLYYCLLQGWDAPVALLRFWIRNIREGRAFSRCKLWGRHVPEEWIGDLYFIDPWSQRRQLQEYGFGVIDIMANNSCPVYFSRWPYYIAQKDRIAISAVHDMNEEKST
jgi:SAM-dependent methyltransferase